ncbi:MAG TPA: hypothetical protein VG937_01765 [Polyangiaceae bacterium]|nr:hypothetical protein [Polyangiaceae bacterium]
MSRLLRNTAVSYSNADLLAVALVALVVSVWAAVAGAGFSLLVLLACEALFFAFYLVGSLFAGRGALAKGIQFDLPLRLLLGYAVVNSALLALAWLSPFGMVANLGGVLLLVLGGIAFSRRERVSSSAASLCFLALCLLAVTLWCQDSISPTSEQGEEVLFKPWVDGFYHSVHIRMFGASHGASTIEDFRMAGVPARPYHYGMYMLPALVKAASGIHSYAVFAGILAPVGVLFTGFAAYALFGSIWGSWAGVGAAIALFLLPDGAQQGMHNKFMSYHWLTQISPSATYGLALLAVAWLFVIKGCTEGSWPKLFTGWAVAAIVVLYKLHYVIASALLLLLIPALFFRAQLCFRKRALWAAFACAVYALGVTLGQKVPGVPLIRFDGSSAAEVLHLVLSFAKGAPLREYLVSHVGRNFSFLSNLLFGIFYVLLAAFGLFLPLLGVLVARLRRREPRLYVLFPLLLLANFLAMFFGLALDMTSSTPDELSHRPIMIVYFFVATWVGGALGLILSESGLKAVALKSAFVIVPALLLVPATFGPGVQLMRAMSSISPVRLPVAYLRVAEYMRAHGEPADLFQHSQFDRTYVFAALSERRPFVAHTLTVMPYRADMVEARSTAVDHLMGIRQAQLVRGTAHAFGIRWFVLERGDRLEWPAEIADKPVLEAGRFKLYAFE